MHLTRRRLIATVPAVLLAPPLLPHAWAAAPPGGKLAFSVWRNGSRIGAHTAAFSTSGDTMTVHTMAHFSVGLGPIKLYTYKYDVTETWSGGMLTGVEADTNDNGRAEHCTCMRQGNALMVTGSKSGSYTAPAGSIAGTHWNKAELQAPIINPEDGVLMKFAVADMGQDNPPGAKTPAQHYALTGFATLDLWYDASNTWVGLRATAKDKSVVEYHQG